MTEILILYYRTYGHVGKMAEASAEGGTLVVGLSYSAAGQMRLDEITDGSPYSATTIAGGKGERQPSENELGHLATVGGLCLLIVTGPGAISFDHIPVPTSETAAGEQVQGDKP